MNGNVELRFITNVLNDEGDRLFRNQGHGMAKVLKFHSKEILSGRKKQVKVLGEANAVLQLSFKAYTRFLDIKKERSGKMKSFKIYNRFVYGHYNAIAYRLSNDFTEEVKASIRRFNSNNNG